MVRFQPGGIRLSAPSDWVVSTGSQARSVRGCRSAKRAGRAGRAAYLSLAILIGLGANALFGLWWADPLVALTVAVVAVRAGLRTWQGESCDGAY
jgi:divalent metal cation (Fe/Co/Zn/Cd) transporter